MEKVDFKKLMKPYWQPPVGKFVIVDVPELAFAMIDGRGAPEGPAFMAAIGWLYAVSYGLKFASKGLGRDYGVAPLEALWWSDDPTRFSAAARADWNWRALLMQPDWIDGPMFEAAVAKAGAKLGARPPSLRLERFAEGLCVQTMHVGPYAAEAPVIARLHDEFIPANGLRETGHHHEIYIGDPRRSAPEKLKTVLRQPVKRV